MKRIDSLLISLIALGIAMPSYADTLEIYNWARNLGKETIADFERMSGHQINEVIYDNEGDRNRNLLTSKTIDYDLLVLDSYSVKMFADSGMLQKMSDLNIKGLEQQEELFRDSCGDYGIPFAWGTMGISYRSDLIKENIDSWLDLFNPPPSVGRNVVMLLDELDTTSVLMLALGKPMDSDKPEDLAAGLELLKQQYGNLIQYGFGITYADLHGEDKGMTMSMSYQGNTTELIELTGHKDWKYVVPKEGSPLWVDCWAIPKSKQVSPVVVEFLSYLNDPQVAAKNSLEIWHTSTHTGITPYVTEEYLADETVTLPADVMARIKPTPSPSMDGLRLRQWLVHSAKINYKQWQERNNVNQ